MALAEIKPLHVSLRLPSPSVQNRVGVHRGPKHAYKNEQGVCHRSFLPRRSVLSFAPAAMHIRTARPAWKMDGPCTPIERQQMTCPCGTRGLFPTVLMEYSRFSGIAARRKRGSDDSRLEEFHREPLTDRGLKSKSSNSGRGSTGTASAARTIRLIASAP
jgi:hypothetical protein